MPVDVAPPDKIRLLAALVELEATLRGAQTMDTAAQVIVNETRNLMVYRQAVLFERWPGGKWRVRAVSDVVDPDRGGPFLLWLTQFLAQGLPGDVGYGPRGLVAADLPQDRRQQWVEWLPEFGHWTPLVSLLGDPMGGVFWFRDIPFCARELWLLGHLSSSFGQAWERLALLQRRSCLGWLQARMTFGRTALVTSMVVAVLAFVPVHLTVLAPSHVVPVDPVAIHSPLEGVVAQVHVQPNAEVEAGTLLFSLEAGELKNRHAVVLKGLEVEAANLEKAQRKGFHDDRSRSEVALLQAMVAMKATEVRFAAEQLVLVDVRAPRAGVVVFNDPNQWLGQPVRVGETVMYLADPGRMELEAWIPTADAIALEKGTKVFMFLNIHPHTPLAARLRMADFAARQSPDGFLGFRVRARFEDGEGPVRFGLRGSARFQGDRVRLWYYLLRRPLAFFRQQVGW
ncbi:MAG TPA: HlyD family efflux transporter periplasmic adaptor subunit [Magnetococcales bacterium]|nr:HlyD family efflux transporter periplasmic adaptor subunit [Magnetococcales bacterium]